MMINSISYDDQYYQSKSWLNSNSTKNTEVVKKEHKISFKDIVQK